MFYIPEPLARGYKTHNGFHKYRMKWKFISDSFYHMLNSQKHKKNTVLLSLLPILLRKARQRRGFTYDVINELRRLSLSKCLPALCHKLIYEIAIFHSINWEKCDKYIYYIVVCPPKTGYIVTFLTVNWRYGSISMDNWLYSCLYPRTTGYIVVFPQAIIKFLLQSVCTSVTSQLK